MRLNPFARSGLILLSLAVALVPSSVGAVQNRAPATADAHLESPQKRDLEPAAAEAQLRPLTYRIPEYTFQVVNSWPHDPNAFTQGLIYQNGIFYESTGLYGNSSLRRVNATSGEVLEMRSLPREYFAEGLTEFDGKLYQLTWRENRCFVYDRETFAPIREFTYTGEGWGITHDGTSLIMSDGTNVIRFLDPETFQVRRTIKVFLNGAPLQRINELEYIDGEIFANIWLTDEIVRIEPNFGWVLGRIDLRGLLPPDTVTQPVDVLNGIAYDAETHRLFLTGKFWPRIFEVRLVAK